ncbi:hypothetical protein [Desulfatitalea alkaliphila]|uniref:Uncharacterized protein n=1 Tax=Desulfatitalea alkaliphila TaxID=2929485 RepID=A0AA41UM85_9BACT|nr:hypothetical protein [Desulfatitalea alkaliphila]MCJ8502366.1 hypothetical protein [Desulfatitalea alkaliphila]
MEGARQTGVAMWVLDDPKPDYQNGVKRLLLSFTQAVAALLDAGERDLLEQLLRVMQDNCATTRAMLEMIDDGATIGDVRRYLENNRE